MKYMLLIYGAQPTEAPSQEDIQAEMNTYWEYEKAVAEAGVSLGSEALQGVETATTVEVRPDGERVVTDGPFAETREILGGYYLLDVPDLDAALDWAARCPGSHNGNRIEVRPIQEFEAP
ncbi:YciI family protein [Pseudonocardia broussonetiae]|uniref:YciI family protein n=1 Tax=Pseudonocardia broussonetiae TaxID=2736640 RepID=UPI00196248EC|nr:YciI family protein [Pseudonocardia broussonetiae]